MSAVARATIAGPRPRDGGRRSHERPRDAAGPAQRTGTVEARLHQRPALLPEADHAWPPDLPGRQEARGNTCPPRPESPGSAKVMDHHATGRMLSADRVDRERGDDLSATPRGRDRSE